MHNNNITQSELHNHLFISTVDLMVFAHIFQAIHILIKRQKYFILAQYDTISDITINTTLVIVFPDQKIKPFNYIANNTAGKLLKIKYISNNAVKFFTWRCLNQLKKIRIMQKDFTKQIGTTCVKHNILFLLKFLVYPLKNNTAPTSYYINKFNKHAKYIIHMIKEFSANDFGINIFKLKNIISTVKAPNTLVNNNASLYCSKYFYKLAKISNRPWVMLLTGAHKINFKNILYYTYLTGANGFLSSPIIWWNIENISKPQSGMANKAVAYIQKLAMINTNQATLWYKHLFYQNNLTPSRAHKNNFSTYSQV